MIRDYLLQFERYALPGSAEQTKAYLEEYWLTRDEYAHQWRPIQDSIFNPAFKWFPDLVFNPGCKIMTVIGGVLFTEESFHLLMGCAAETGDKNFVIVEHYDESNPPHDSGPPLRFKFPTNIRWKEINKTASSSVLAEGVCYELFQRPVRNYYVFGDSGKWGRYVANDYELPIEIIGVRPDSASAFEEYRRQSEEQRARLKERLPQAYKRLMGWQ